MRRRNYGMILVLILLSLSLGYALIQTDLSIIGVSKMAPTSWNVYFDNPRTTAGSVTLSQGDVAPTINPTTLTEVSYTVTLTEPGDFYEFLIDVKNTGTLDAMIESISTKLNNVEITNLPAYMSFSVTYSDGAALAPNHLLNHASTETFKVRVGYRTDIDPSDLPDEITTNVITFGVTYIQKNSNAIPRPIAVSSPFVLPVNRTADNLQYGDELYIEGTTEEHFYFILYDGDDVVLLAKYNLDVGPSAMSVVNETGIQNVNASGWDIYTGTIHGNVQFSQTNYWDDNGAPKSKYSGSYYPGPYAEVYDTDYVALPDFSQGGQPGFNITGYSIAAYVERYKTILNGAGYEANVKSARLLTYQEASTNASCSYGSSGCPTSTFITNGTYWLSSASYINTILTISMNGDLFDVAYDNFSAGVRPVIVVAKANL